MPHSVKSETNSATLSCVLLLSGVSALACTSETEPSPGVFAPQVSRVVLEVDYADGAEPYTEGLASGDVWNLFEDNARALFGEEKTFEIPHTLDAMEAIGEVPGTSFDAPEILALADQHRTPRRDANSASYYALWLDAQYEEDGEVQPQVLGVSLGDTGVIAMFKPTIEGSGIGRLGVVTRYVEQATIVHEFGHAVGLVDNGLPLTSSHLDNAHGAHCTNESCVMYYTVEGVTGVVSFVEQYMTTGETVLFSEECLADARAARSP